MDKDPSFVDKKHIRMGKFDTDTNSYTTQQGNAFTVEGMMPVPYTLQINVDMGPAIQIKNYNYWNKYLFCLILLWKYKAR